MNSETEKDFINAMVGWVSPLGDQGVSEGKKMWEKNKGNE